MGQTLAGILEAAAEGRFPPDDGGVTIVPQHNARDAGVMAFTAHSVVFLDEDPVWIRGVLAEVDTDPLAAPMNARFLTALLDRTGRHTETIDLLTVASALPGEPPVALKEITDADHPRATRARTRRDDVRVWQADGGVVVIGRGVAGRWEMAIEVDPGERHHGLGRALAVASRHLIPAGEMIWSQQAPGNARAVRSFHAAGFRPVGSEALLGAP
ncbi:GNAT family N-acetyltransferase [Paractinoplanes durhamensis]|uniref:N-acetyltransferase n=1 Tax=Paractinoplanes durhamensis TaxID=113563 RepID=A0ABQ3Z2K9_9ACTN|nr:GNAT family N-acetyltransferase [Actinoplanes durhamensis]GIE04063.1 N-acetyltransferase [Actinoplanes durhamensis]